MPKVPGTSKRRKVGADPEWKVLLQKSWGSFLGGNLVAIVFMLEATKIARGGTSTCPFNAPPTQKDKHGNPKPSFRDDRSFEPNEVSRFLNKVVRKTKGCLEVLVARARRTHRGFRAPCFFVTAQLFAWFLEKRQEAFYCISSKELQFVR